MKKLFIGQITHLYGVFSIVQTVSAQFKKLRNVYLCNVDTGI